MYVLCHVKYGYLSEFHLNESGLSVDFKIDPYLAIQFEQKSQVYPILTFLALRYVDIDLCDHLLFEIHQLI